MNQTNILHIEDDLSDAILIRQLLQKSHRPNSQNITNVSKLADALKELKQNDYNVVILDLGLSDVSGLDNLRCIKEENPHIPIIVLTGSNDEKLAQQALLEGAQEFLFKGQSSGDILKRIIASSIVRKAAENELNRQLHYDPLTNLPNRLFFKKVVETLLCRAKRRKVQEALFFVDLNAFKQVNDTYGHECGNYVLSVAAKRMEDCLRSSDIIARYAGDEFVIYLGDKDSDITQADCENVIHKLVQTIEEPIQYNEEKISISMSIGVSFFPNNGVDYADLINAADVAMYQAKKSDKSSYVFADMNKLQSVAVH